MGCELSAMNSVSEQWMNFSTIRFKELEAGIGLITLNRPDRLNVLNLEMLEGLHNLFDKLCDRDKTRVLIVIGEGRAAHGRNGS